MCVRALVRACGCGACVTACVCVCGGGGGVSEQESEITHVFVSLHVRVSRRAHKNASTPKCL